MDYSREVRDWWFWLIEYYSRKSKYFCLDVKIIGSEYATQQADLFGFRILVSDYSAVVNDFLAYYKGFARISNCEMVHGGQFNRNFGEDVQYGILISNMGEYNASRPTYVKSSAFHHGLGVAIGILSSAGVLIENNIVHHTIDFGIRVEGKNNLIRRNLVTVNYWGSTFLTSEANSDMFYWGSIDVSHADSVTLEDNFIAGSERVGYNTRGKHLIVLSTNYCHYKYSASFSGLWLLGLRHLLIGPGYLHMLFFFDSMINSV